MKTQISRRLVPGLLAAAAAASLALAPGASAAPKAPVSKCNAGDIKTESVTTVVNGQPVTTTKKYVCNKKGQWRQVKDLRGGGGGVVAAPGDTAVQR